MKSQLCAIALLALGCSLADGLTCEDVDAALKNCNFKGPQDDWTNWEKCVEDSRANEQLQESSKCFLKEVEAVDAKGFNAGNFDVACEVVGECKGKAEGVQGICKLCKIQMMEKSADRAAADGMNCVCNLLNQAKRNYGG